MKCFWSSNKVFNFDFVFRQQYLVLLLQFDFVLSTFELL